YDGNTIQIKGYEPIETQTLLWAAGVKPMLIEGFKPDQIAGNGRMIVDEYHQLVNSQDVYVIGDLCLQASEEYPRGHPQVAQVAIPQAANLVYYFIGAVKGKPLKPFKYKDLGSMATVGRKRAVVDLPFVKFQGFFAWIVWLFVHLMAILGVKNKILVFMNWAWSYLSFDPSLRLLIRPSYVRQKEREEMIEDKKDRKSVV